MLRALDAVIASEGGCLMPLSPSNNRPDSHDDRKAIGFWMTIEGKHPVEPVRVFVTYECLREIDPLQRPDLPAVFDIFKKNRNRVETVASKTFDAQGADDGEYKGKPIVIVGSMDIRG
jgi:hypothetical protein